MLKTIRSIWTFGAQKLSLPSFKEYGLHSSIMTVLDKKELFTPSPIQDMSFMELKRSKNINNFVLIAPTGTGKTLAYLLPMMDTLKRDEDDANQILTEPVRVRSLVIVPSKELVDQVTDVCKEFSHTVKLKCLGLTSIQKFSQEQRVLTENGVDIAIGTIERIGRHAEQKSLFVSRLRYLVIDEVDTLIDSGNEEYLGNLCRAILKKQREVKVGPVPRILLVGATCTGKFERFATSVFGEDIKYLMEKNSHMHLENLTHEFIHCRTLDKTEPLLRLLGEMRNKAEGVLIFCNSISSCQFLERTLQENKWQAVSLHGSVPRNIRAQNVTAFRSRSVKIMVATDLAARGLDFPFLSHVINFDFPSSTSDYLHRAGRTGRAGKKGHIVSLYHNNDEQIINELKESNDTNTPLKIKGSSYSKINREMLTKSRPAPKATPLDKLNKSKRLGLPDSYIQMKQSMRQSDMVPGYKPEKKQQSKPAKLFTSRREQLKRTSNLRSKPRVNTYKSERQG